MYSELWLYPLLFGINILGLGWFVHYAHCPALMDIPKARSAHTVPTISGSGIFFVPNFILSLLIYAPHHYLSAIALLALGIISFWDDLCDLPVHFRLPIHFLASAMLLFDLQPAWPLWFWPIALILLTGWLNAFNFMDGINGITALYGGVLLASLYLAQVPYSAAPPIAIGLFPVLLAFLVFNFRKNALCFAGDTGSISLAFIIAWAILSTGSRPSSLYLLAFPALYGVDSVMTILVRLSRGENIFQPHCSHLYQLLANQGQWDHRLLATLYATLQLGINLLAIHYMPEHSALMQFWILTVIYLALCLGYFFLRRHVLKSA